MSTAVDAASNLLNPSSNFGDKLVEKVCVTFEQMRGIEGTYKENSKKAARELFEILIKRPESVFNKFCKVLEEVEQGQDLLDLIKGNFTLFSV